MAAVIIGVAAVSSVVATTTVIGADMADGAHIVTAADTKEHNDAAKGGVTDPQGTGGQAAMANVPPTPTTFAGVVKLALSEAAENAGFRPTGGELNRMVVHMVDYLSSHAALLKQHVESLLGEAKAAVAAVVQPPVKPS